MVLKTALVLGFAFHCCVLEPNILYIDQKKREAILEEHKLTLWCYFLTNHGHLYANVSLLIELLMVMLASSAEVEGGILAKHLFY